MEYLLSVFKAVSVIFAIAASIGGIRAVMDPIGFAKSFGLPLSKPTTDSAQPLKDHGSSSMSYVALMGVRQLGTGIIILTFAYQNKWTEVATILAIIGILVAGTDAIYLSRAGERGLGRFHAIPGALIAALAGGVLFATV